MKKQGFTLIELLVVIAIVGIMVLFASVAFADYVEDAHRTKYKSNFQMREKNLVENLVKGRLPENYPVNPVQLMDLRDREGAALPPEKVLNSPKILGLHPISTEGYAYYLGQEVNEGVVGDYFIFYAKNIPSLVYRPWARMNTTDGWSDSRHLGPQDGYAGVYTITGEANPSYTIKIKALGVRDVRIRPLGDNPSFVSGGYVPNLTPDGKPTGFDGTLEFKTNFSTTPTKFVVSLIGDEVEEHLVICKNMYDPEPPPPPNPGDGW